MPGALHRGWGASAGDTEGREGGREHTLSVFRMRKASEGVALLWGCPASPPCALVPGADPSLSRQLGPSPGYGPRLAYHNLPYHTPTPVFSQ